MAKPTFMPNLGIKKPAAPAAKPVVAPVAPPVVEPETTIEETGVEEMAEETAVEEEVVEKKERKKSDKERAKANRQMTAEDTKFVIENVKTMSYTEMATARGITKHQVNRVLMQVKKDLRERCGGDEAKLAQVETIIKEQLSRPEDTLPGAGGGRSGVVKDSIDNIVDNILSGIV